VKRNSSSKKWGLIGLIVLAIAIVACDAAPATTAPTTATQQQQPSSVPAAPVAQATTAPADPTKVPQVTVQQSALPTISAQSQPPSGVTGFAAPAAGPNLLAKSWEEHLGVQVSELKPATGKKLIDPKAGDLWFYSNSGTTWGATNPANSVWIIDAKTKKTVLEVAPADGKGNSSHGLAVSGDGKFIYLPELGPDNHIDVLDGFTFEVVQTIKTLGRVHHQKLWHDPVSGKDLILGEDFNWGFVGSGLYVLDPSQKNAVVGGMNLGEAGGNPYVTTPSPDGSFILVTVPAGYSGYRGRMDGFVGKIDPKTWKFTGITPMVDPLWAEITIDNKFSYVTSGDTAKIYKIDLATMDEVGEVMTGPGPWGARLSYDQTRIYSADKGEGRGYNQQGHTTTIIDLQTMGVIAAPNIGLTTDHAILSPDGKEVWYTSNADHNIYVMDAKTYKMTVLQDPADGDIHGGVFVQWTDDGKGGVKGEVVSDYSGLHGSALKTEMAYLKQPQATIAINNSGFMQKSITVEAGATVRVTIKDVGSSSSGVINFESADMGIKAMSFKPGEFQEISWTAPTKTGDLKATTNKSPNKELTITVKAPAAAQPTPAAAAPGAADVMNVTIKAKDNTWDITTLAVKPGQKVKFTMINGDDEKHNMVGVGDNLDFTSPDFSGGGTASWTWTAPDQPISFKVICSYHPQMKFNVDVK
jgi:plastocyanin